MALQRADVDRSIWDDFVPDPLDAQCGYCGKAVAMARIGRILAYDKRATPVPGEWEVRVHATYICPRSQCRMPSLVFFDMNEGRYPSVIDGPKLIPRGAAEPIPGLPDAIQADRLEAWSCCWGGDYRAAIIMGRAAIQRAVRQLDAKGDGLKAEINDLHARHKITDALRDFAHETRIAGDEAAHPTTLGEVDEADAIDGLDFMDEFLEHAIALPARRDARKAGRSNV
ncbi:MAG TPA: DUF4145 domain-containing protein [Gaiellaceae bacterium]|nr:DUF4145 domain-containing protein [Gaiellaceae bacterium]